MVDGGGEGGRWRGARRAGAVDPVSCARRRLPPSPPPHTHSLLLSQSALLLASLPLSASARRPLGSDKAWRPEPELSQWYDKAFFKPEKHGFGPKPGHPEVKDTQIPRDELLSRREVWGLPVAHPPDRAAKIQRKLASNGEGGAGAGPRAGAGTGAGAGANAGANVGGGSARVGVNASSLASSTSAPSVRYGTRGDGSASGSFSPSSSPLPLSPHRSFLHDWRSQPAPSSVRCWGPRRGGAATCVFKNAYVLDGDIYLVSEDPPEARSPLPELSCTYVQSEPFRSAFNANHRIKTVSPGELAAVATRSLPGHRWTSLPRAEGGDAALVSVAFQDNYGHVLGELGPTFHQLLCSALGRCGANDTDVRFLLHNRDPWALSVLPKAAQEELLPCLSAHPILRLDDGALAHTVVRFRRIAVGVGARCRAYDWCRPNRGRFPPSPQTVLSWRGRLAQCLGLPDEISVGWDGPRDVPDLDAIIAKREREMRQGGAERRMARKTLAAAEEERGAGAGITEARLDATDDVEAPPLPRSTNAADGRIDRSGGSEVSSGALLGEAERIELMRRLLGADEPAGALAGSAGALDPDADVEEGAEAIAGAGADGRVRAKSSVAGADGAVGAKGQVAVRTLLPDAVGGNAAAGVGGGGAAAAAAGADVRAAGAAPGGAAGTAAPSASNGTRSSASPRASIPAPLRLSSPRLAPIRDRMRLLIVTRPLSDGRGFVNAHQMAREIRAARPRLDVDVYELSSATLREQANAYARADVLLQMHGAALGNVIFLPRGAVLIDAVPRNNDDKHVWADVMIEDLQPLGLHLVKMAPLASPLMRYAIEQGQADLLAQMTQQQRDDLWLRHQCPGQNTVQFNVYATCVIEWFLKRSNSYLGLDETLAAVDAAVGSIDLRELAIRRALAEAGLAKREREHPGRLRLASQALDYDQGRNAYGNDMDDL